MQSCGNTSQQRSDVSPEFIQQFPELIQLGTRLHRVLHVGFTRSACIFETFNQDLSSVSLMYYTGPKLESDFIITVSEAEAVSRKGLTDVVPPIRRNSCSASVTSVCQELAERFTWKLGKWGARRNLERQGPATREES